MHTVACIMTNSASEQFFNVNDIDDIVRSGLKALEEAHSSRARVHTFKVLNLVLDISAVDYWQYHSDRLKLFNTTLEE